MHSCNSFLEEIVEKIRGKFGVMLRRVSEENLKGIVEDFPEKRPWRDI